MVLKKVLESGIHERVGTLSKIRMCVFIQGFSFICANSSVNTDHEDSHIVASRTCSASVNGEKQIKSIKGIK